MHPLVGRLTNTILKIVSVQKLTERDGKALINTVNLTERTCTCHVYQQSGVPCICAIKAMEILGLTSEEIFSRRLYFDVKLEALSWRNFYDNPDMGTEMPADSSVEERYQNDILNLSQSKSLFYVL